jgi:hypothetical protein
MSTRDLKGDVSGPSEDYIQGLHPLSQDATYSCKNKGHGHMVEELDYINRQNLTPLIERSRSESIHPCRCLY